MTLLLTQYSYIFIAFGLAAIAGLILLTQRPRWNEYLAFAVIVGGLAAAWVVLHPRQTLLMDDAQEVQSMIGAGKPVLLEFQSPY